jgi:Fic family protein
MTVKQPPRATDPAVAELQASKKFINWKSETKREPKSQRELTDLLRLELAMAEKHFTAAELASLWGVSPQTIRNVFQKEPGVLRITQSNGNKRSYVLTRIPESVAQRVHKRLSAVPQVQQ